MFSKLQKFIGRRSLAVVLVVTIFSSSFLPAFAPRTQAAGLPVIDVPAWIRTLVDVVGQNIGQRMVDQMVKSTITWANSGFEGNPAFVRDPKKYFGDIASGVVGDAISDSKLGFLCSPFQASVKLSLVNQYVDTYKPQCTLEKIGVNLDNFYDDFDKGGWKAFNEVTQKDQNNPYGAYMLAKTQIDTELANALGLKNDELKINQGFMSFRSCAIRNEEPSESVMTQYKDGDKSTKENIRIQYPKWYPEKEKGACVLENPVSTPGATIKAQLDKVLPSGLDKLISVQHIEQLVGAFANGLLSRYVFGQKGLFGDNYADSYSGSSGSPISGKYGYDWKFCAKEGEFCSFSGTEQVRYGGRTSAWSGARESFVEKTLTGGTICSEAFFIDENNNFETAPTENRWCEVQGLIPPPPPAGTAILGNNFLACRPDKTDAAIDEKVTWFLSSTYPSESTYGWSGDEIYGPATTTRSTNKFFDINYKTFGQKSMSVSVFDGTAEELRAVSCSETVLVIPSP